METLECALKTVCQEHQYEGKLTPPSTIQKP